MKKYTLSYYNICKDKQEDFTYLNIDDLLLKIELLLMEDCCDNDSVTINTIDHA